MIVFFPFFSILCFPYSFVSLFKLIFFVCLARRYFAFRSLFSLLSCISLSLYRFVCLFFFFLCFLLFSPWFSFSCSFLTSLFHAPSHLFLPSFFPLSLRCFLSPHQLSSQGFTLTLFLISSVFPPSFLLYFLFHLFLFQLASVFRFLVAFVVTVLICHRLLYFRYSLLLPLLLHSFFSFPLYRPHFVFLYPFLSQFLFIIFLFFL